MKILQVHNAYREAGGEDAVVRAEAELLTDAGHVVTRLHVANPQGAVRAAAGLALAPWNPAAARRVGEAAERLRPDVAHMHNTWYRLSPSVLGALKRRGVPVVMTLHNYRVMCINGQLLRRGQVCTRCVGRLPLPGLRYRCYRDSWGASAAATLALGAAHAAHVWQRHVDLFLAMSQFARDQFIAGGLPEEHIRVKPHFVPDPGERQLPPSASGKVLFVGRLSREKGLYPLLDAWAEAATGGCELLVVGAGPLRRELEARALPRVRFLGWQPPDEVRKLMLNARLLVFPSIWYETFGLTIVEAMAAGVPVLASDLGGTPELLGPLAGDWLVPPGDARSWAAALSATVQDNGRIDAAGCQARRRYADLYSPGRGLELLEGAYRSVSSLRR